MHSKDYLAQELHKAGLHDMAPFLSDDELASEMIAKLD